MVKYAEVFHEKILTFCLINRKSDKRYTNGLRNTKIVWELIIKLLTFQNGSFI